MDDEPEGRARGGHARAAKLSPQERAAIASKAAKKRWESIAPSHDLPRVLEGYSNVLRLAGAELPCAVINGRNGVQVLTETGITEAVLGTRSGASKRLKKAASDEGALLPLFVAPGQLKPFISSELIEGPLKPIDYLGRRPSCAWVRRINLGRCMQCLAPRPRSRRATTPTARSSTKGRDTDQSARRDRHRRIDRRSHGLPKSSATKCTSCLS